MLELFLLLLNQLVGGVVLIALHPEPMSANTPSASAAMIRLAKFVTDMEIVLALDLCRIATNTGE